MCDKQIGTDISGLQQDINDLRVPRRNFHSELLDLSPARELISIQHYSQLFKYLQLYAFAI